MTKNDFALTNSLISAGLQTVDNIYSVDTVIAPTDFFELREDDR